MKTKQKTLYTSSPIDRLLFIVFVAIGVLNIVFVHAVPAVFYIAFSMIYYPIFNTYLERRWGIVVPLFLKVILALIVLWGTLAVSDLAEILGL